MSDSANAFIDDLAGFVTASPSSYHAAAVVADRLRAAGFEEVDETQPLPKTPGKRFIQRGGAVVAWHQPKKITSEMGYRIVGAHTDSPALKVKPSMGSDSVGWHQIPVEIYGGMLLNSWLDRDLGIAGRVRLRDGSVRLVRTGAVARVPQLAIHLDRTVNEKLSLDRQVHMQPIACTTGKDGLLGHLAEMLGVAAEDIVAHDLVTFDTQAPSRFGLHDEFFASSRLDNLSSTHAGLAAFEQLGETPHLPIYVTFDHEEVGSATSSGAGGSLLEDAMTRVASVLGLDWDATRAMFARSVCVSADAGHLVHPNYPGHHDPLVHPQPNQGPLTKINANQRYASDAVGIGLWHDACDAAGVPNQSFVSNNAVPCGSTIGPITATRLGITTVDVGIGLLSMHSVREMCGAQDPEMLSRGLRAFWELGR